VSKIILFSKRVLRILIGITVVAVIATGYFIAFENKVKLEEVKTEKQETNFILNKSDFVCTKVEQQSKNLDDVACVQYTHKKYHEEAIELNKSIIK